VEVVDGKEGPVEELECIVLTEGQARLYVNKAIRCDETVVHMRLATNRFHQALCDGCLVLVKGQKIQHINGLYSPRAPIQTGGWPGHS
jgi:hypothetical protein